MVTTGEKCMTCVHNDVCYVGYILKELGPPLFIREFSPAPYCEKYLAAYAVNRGLELYRAETEASNAHVKQMIADGRGDEL